MLPQEIIRRKRDRLPLSAAEIGEFISGVAQGAVGEGQVAAFCMAVLLNGMDMEERVALTMAMARSGDTMEWRGLDGPVLDKHSTGGVGDKVSLMLAPMVAACGGFVPMIAGRGLGHTGGTIDKLESIPGYQVLPDTERLRATVKTIGCAIIGATQDIAPADRIIYGVRDVTGTVESIDLITASILSKKLSAGLDALVMDVKFGSGAFMPLYEDSMALAQSIVGVASGAGVRCAALMTDMNETLGRTAGNAIEIREAVEFLRNENIDPRLYEVTVALCAELLVLGRLANSEAEARAMAETALSSGRAAEIFGKMVAALGGPHDMVEHFARHSPLAPHTREVFSHDRGVVQSVDTRALGLAVIELGGGRRLTTDKIDHGVGLSALAAIGETVGPRERPLAIIHARDDETALRVEKNVRNAYSLAPAGSDIVKNAPVRERVTAS